METASTCSSTNTNIFVKSSQMDISDSMYNNIKGILYNCSQDHLENTKKIEFVNKSRTNLEMILIKFTYFEINTLKFMKLFSQFLFISGH